MKGRITPSKFQRVFTRSKTLRKIEEIYDEVSAPSTLVSEFMCHKPNIKSLAMKHSLPMSWHPKKRYAKTQKQQPTSI